METRLKNIAILAHIDAGKTTLSERILFLGKTIHNLGEVDEGLATLDYLPEEKKRGITIEAGWSHFHWKNWRINLVDTPGHIDFGAEVDCVLEAIDGAVVVLSAVRGVQTQTIENWKKLQRHKRDSLVFVNKTELEGKTIDDLLYEIEESFNCPPNLMSYPKVTTEGFGVVDVLAGKLLVKRAKESRDVLLLDLDPEQEKERLEYLLELETLASEYSDEVLEALVNEERAPMQALYEGLAAALKAKAFLPVYCGSAKQNVGVRSLMNGVRFLFSAADEADLNTEILGRVINVRHHADYGKLYLFKAHGLITEEIPGLRFFYGQCGFFG